MSDKTIQGGAAPALAAHSKDASARSKNPASSATPAKPRGAAARKVRSAAAEVSSVVSNDVRSLGGLKKVEGFGRENPITAMLATGIIGLILGSVLVRR